MTTGTDYVDDEFGQGPPAAGCNAGRDIFAALLAQPSGLIGLAVTLVIVFAAVAAPWVAPHDPLQTHVLDALSPPSGTYLFGNDELGRDVLSRLIYGARPSLAVAFLAVISGGAVGTAIGMAAGYYRGLVEALVMRLCDAMFAFPLILIGIGAVVILGAGVGPVGLALGLGVLPTFARLARAEVMKELERDYVRASRGMGGDDLWIVLRHILPNIGTSIIVQVATATSAAVVLAASLDFLGLGTQPPQPSWGNMLQASRLYLSQSPIYALAPGVAITVFVVGINLMAAALTNALDPRIRTGIIRARS